MTVLIRMTLDALFCYFGYLEVQCKQFLHIFNKLANYSLPLKWYSLGDVCCGSNFIFPCFKLIIIHYNTQKQKKRKFEPRIKLNHNTM